MATAGLNAMMLWGDFEGRKVEERWLLGQLVRPEGRRAWFEAIGPDGVPLMLSITEALNDEDELLERLRAAAEIRHVNVVAIREAVISHLDDVPVVVAAMEITEENLGDVLRERLLTAVEGRQVLDAVLSALGILHANGLVHGHVDATSVLAIGETIKLRSDCVQMMGTGFGSAASEDVRAAARMATHAVTGRYPAGENDPVLQLLPESMARAVRRALSGAAGATEVAALAGTRLAVLRDVIRDVVRIEPLSKTVKVNVAPDVVMPKAKPGDMPVATTAEVPAAMKTDAMLDARPAAAGRVIAMRSLDAQSAQGALFAEPFLPNEREGEEAELNEEEPEPTRWQRAPYVIAAAIAVVLVAVFTLYGLMHSDSTQQKPATPATSAEVRGGVSLATELVVRVPGSWRN